MIYYVFYHNNKFKGYTNDKKIKDNFLQSRKQKYTIKKFKEREIPKEIINSPEFNNYDLVYYCGYHITTELVLFEYEIDEFERSMMDFLFETIESLYSMKERLIFLKLSKDDRKFINIVFQELINNLTLFGESCDHEPIYDEVVNVVKFFNERFSRS